ncbi:hypothetical protein U9M48_013075, partial [Paspalum notatum var. saurae]
MGRVVLMRLYTQEGEHCNDYRQYYLIPKREHEGNFSSSLYHIAVSHVAGDLAGGHGLQWYQIRRSSAWGVVAYFAEGLLRRRSARVLHLVGDDYRNSSSTSSSKRLGEIPNTLIFEFTSSGPESSEMKAQMEMNAKTIDKNYQEQLLIAQQVKATEENPFHTAEQGGTSTQNHHKGFKHHCNTSRPHRPHHSEPEQVPRHALPKLQFPRFDGSHPKIWKDQCEDYFSIYKVPEIMWVTTAAMHFQDNAAKWLQAYKQTHKLSSWSTFCTDVELKFGADDYRIALTELMALQQTESVEVYTKAFQTLQFEICLHNSTYDDLFFTSKYISGLQDEIKGILEAQVPTTVEQASRIAKIQQKILERQRYKHPKPSWHQRSHQSTGKTEHKPPQNNPNLWRDRQLRDYRRDNGLCYHCGEKFHPSHNEVCAKKSKAQVNALIVNDLDKEIPEKVLNQLAVEDAIAEEFCNLSLNALAGTEGQGCLKLRAIVNKKVMLLLIDSGSSHSFINFAFVNTVGLSTTAAPIQQVKVANGQILLSDKIVSNLSWWCQGYTLQADMRVLEIGAYDAILGYNWLQQHSPMTCDWAARTLQFSHNNELVTLKGISTTSDSIAVISGEQVSKWISGNDVWALALLDLSAGTQTEQLQKSTPPPVLKLLDHYKDIFENPTTLPAPRVYDHHIPLVPQVVPVNCKPYRYSPLHKTEIERQVTELLQAGLITHSSGPFASPVLLVQKKYGSWRMCVDYRKLNALTIKNRFPMPVIEEILEELGQAKYFTKLDMKSCYHRVRMASQDEYKTAFKTHHGHYQFKVMPFGLTNAPATFQCIMNEVLSPFLWKFVLVFLDDILIYSKSLEDHLKHLSLVLDKLKEHQFYLKHSKCSFGQTSVEYLGHVISMDGVGTDPQKTTAMVNWPRPASMTELRAFLGLTGYYRRFVQHYGHLTKPLTQILRLKQFTWSDTAEKAFINLKQAMVQTPVLALPNFDLPFKIETDACDTGIGAVLMQNGRPVAYLSKAFGPSHSKYSIYEKKFLALIMAVDKWKQYLHYQEFIIRTDHKSLAYLMEQNLHSELQRKAMSRLMVLKFKILYNKGKDNVAADALSRVNHLMLLQAVSTVQPAWIQEVLNSYTIDPKAQTMLTQLALANPNEAGYSLDQGLIKYKDKIWLGNNSAIQTKVISAFHSTPIGGHSGINTTYYKVKNLFAWKGMKTQVEEFIKQCSVCQQAKHSLHHPFGLLQPLPIPSAAWHDISIDFIEGLPKSEGYNCILVVVDRLTKFAHFIAIKHPYTAMGIAQIILDNVIRLHGFPKSIVSDRDTIFLSHFWQELFRLYEVKLHMSTAYHPQMDGQTERVNQSLEMYLRCAIHDRPQQWKQWLSLAELWYNSTFHSAIQCSPFKALYGQDPNLVAETSIASSTVESMNDMMVDRAVQLQQLKIHLAAAQNLPILDAPSVQPQQILERRLVKRGNTAVPQ